ncbi:MAG: LysE family translocator [Desulfuromonas sp.]|nr:LysE family translocator [Desulfuromonas sp.]
MLAPQDLLSFIIAALLLGLAPGPDNLFVLTQSALRGRAAGLLVTLGLCTGLLGHSMAVAFGVAVIFQSSLLAFSLLKFVGAGYLAYLAWKAFRAAAVHNGEAGGENISLARLYRRGIIMNITNPKVSIFFLAFLPQFADPAQGSITLQILLLGGVFILVTIVVFGAIALLAGTFGQWLIRSQQRQKVLHRLAGGVFLALALKLVCTER